MFLLLFLLSNGLPTSPFFLSYFCDSLCTILKATKWMGITSGKIVQGNFKLWLVFCLFFSYIGQFLQFEVTIGGGNLSIRWQIATHKIGRFLQQQIHPFIVEYVYQNCTLYFWTFFLYGTIISRIVQNVSLILWNILFLYLEYCILLLIGTFYWNTGDNIFGPNVTVLASRLSPTLTMNAPSRGSMACHLPSSLLICRPCTSLTWSSSVTAQASVCGDRLSTSPAYLHCG